MKLIITIAGLGGFLYGVDFGVIAAAEPYMKAMGVYTDGQISHIVGAVLLGGLVSSITAGWLSNFFGRKKMIVAASAMFLIAIPIVSLSLGSYLALYAGRVLQGMSAGYMAVVMPMYLTETLPPAIRGRGTGVFQFCLGLGLVVAAGAAFPTPFIRELAVYPIALAIMVCVVACGIRKASLFLTNVGAATFLWLVVAKFFASHAPFTVKGIVLIVAGLALTALNVGIVRIRKTRRA